MRSGFMRVLALAGLCTVLLTAAAWAWTIRSVYFLGGQTVFMEPVPITKGPGQPIDVVPVQENIHVLFGAGGNITVLSGDDGLVVFDTGYDQTGPLVLEALGAIGDTSRMLVVNTHVHDDHIGANSSFASAGATISAHRLGIEALKVELPRGVDTNDIPQIALGARHSFYSNGQSIDLIHVPWAHTNGDLIAVLRPANVIVAGDALSTNALPFLSVGSGATLHGHLSAQDIMLGLSDSDTVFVSGHGPVADRSVLEEINNDLRRVGDRLAWLKSMGVPKRLRVLFHPLQGWPASRQLDGDWEKYWTAIAWESLL